MGGAKRQTSHFGQDVYSCFVVGPVKPIMGNEIKRAEISLWVPFLSPPA